MPSSGPSRLPTEGTVLGGTSLSFSSRFVRPPVGFPTLPKLNLTLPFRQVQVFAMPTRGTCRLTVVWCLRTVVPLLNLVVPTVGPLARAMVTVLLSESARPILRVDSGMMAVNIVVKVTLIVAPTPTNMPKI